jgi:uncharacterized protein (TIRG00374 family)
MKHFKIAFGLMISALFLFLAFRKVDLAQIKQAFSGLKWSYAVLVFLVILLSDWLRALRWRYFLAPIQEVDTGSLFSALIIGYGANTCLPAHLGEFLRAFVLGKKTGIKASAAFATIVTERILDMFSLLAIMLAAIFIYPFPAWIKKSGWIMFAGTLVLLAFVVLLKKRSGRTLGWIHALLKPFPQSFGRRIENLIGAFLAGLVRFKHSSHYPIVFVQTVLIWSCYTMAFWFGFQAFGFRMPWTAPLVLLVITTIGIVVPSSPGYVGTYHLLCQLGLGLYGIAKSPALAFAIVQHALNIVPFFLLGLVFAWKEGINLIGTRTSISETET